MNINPLPQNPRLTRRDFLHLALLAGGAVALAPLLKACSRAGAPAAALAEELLAGLDGLGIDDFFAESYRRWLVRDPENLTVLGLSDLYGVGDGDLTDISDAYIRKTQALESGLLEGLRAYERSAFTPDQALTAEVYDWFLDDLVRGHPFMYDDYPINPIITCVLYNLYFLFTTYHPLNNRQDADDYLSRLSQVGTKISQLIDGLRRRKERGVILPAFMISFILNDVKSLAGGSASPNPFYTSFVERLTGVAGDERQALQDQVRQQIETTVDPAYRQVAETLTDLQAEASNTIGVWQFDDGAEYYAQCLRRQTTLEKTAEEIHQLGLQHVERIQSEMRTLFSGLGYPDGEKIPDLYKRLEHDGGAYVGQEAVAAFEQAIRAAEALLPQAFDLLPAARLEVIGGRDGNYYMPPAYDGSRPGLFFATTQWPVAKFGLKTLAYHETVPGHHLQAAVAQEQAGLPALRQAMQFNAFSEGWALYAERLMWELGAYADDPAGDLGRLQMEAFRAARLVVDTGIHAKKWGFDQAVQYLVESSGLALFDAQGETTRYSVWPGQAASYYTGFLKILELRQKALDALGDRFDLRAFHHLLLVNGSLPLTVLEKLVDSYIGDAA